MHSIVGSWDMSEISAPVSCFLNAHNQDRTLTYFQYDVKLEVHMKINSYSPEFWKKSHNLKWLNAFQRKTPWLSPIGRKNMSCIFKPGLIAFLMCPMKFTFWVFSMVSAYAAPKWPRDYGKEKGYFITHRSLIAWVGGKKDLKWSLLLPDRLLLWIHNFTARVV